MSLLKNCIRLSYVSILLGFVLTSCSTTDEEPYVERPVTEIYNEGLVQLDAGRYEKAADSFDEVERQHPYSEWAAQAQLMSVYAYYKAQKYEKALLGIESFIALHPAYIDVAYAYYMRGLCHYEQTSTVERDQHITQLALESFKELIKKYPNTRYARDARIKIDLLYDHLAAREMDVGRYYQRRKAYYAAINRFKEVVHSYQTTVHVEEALHRLVEVYITIGLTSEAQKTAAVLGYNFPGSSWYNDTYTLMQSHNVAPLESTQSAHLFDAKIFNKQNQYSDEAHLNADAESSEPGVVAEESNLSSDLVRPMERLKSREGYDVAKKKVDDDLSTVEKLGDWFSSGSKTRDAQDKIKLESSANTMAKDKMLEKETNIKSSESLLIASPDHHSLAVEQLPPIAGSRQ